MKSDFLLAITQLSAEKNLPKEVVIGAVESALVSAYRKEAFVPNQNISVKISNTTGKVEVWAEKVVAEKVNDSRQEISLNDARRLRSDIQIGESIIVESTPANAGRIAAQTAKQVILQRLHEAEHGAILEEFAGKEGEIISGPVRRVEGKQAFIDLGRAEALLPPNEQMPNERYRVGQRLKVYLLEVARTPKGSRLVVSRSHPDLLRRLFELEVPEVLKGNVEIKAIAREAGYRSKVAVAAKQEGIDPVGCCVGLRGIRIQNIVSELGGEKIDVVAWSHDDSAFIANALSPAQILGVHLNQKEKIATAIVPDKQLSLAIGKEGQNARLAAKLTGWKIDIKSASVEEAERAARGPEAIEEVTIPETPEVPEVPDAEVPAEAPAEPVLTPVEATAGPIVPASILVTPAPSLRFAEDIFIPVPPKPDSKPAKKKKKREKDTGEGARPRKRRAKDESTDTDEEY
ncbi:MAG: transcription termination factor NusA [Chloroflexota bacterium]